MSGEGGTSCEVELVSCSLSELSSCLCYRDPTVEVGSSRRKNGTHAVDISPEDLFLAAQRAVFSRKPTLIDHLICRNRIAVRMGPKKVKATNNGGVKRKRESDSAGPSKKMKTVASGQTAKGRKGNNSTVRPMKKTKMKEETGSNRFSTRISLSKGRCGPLTLRSGKKMADLLKKKRMKAAKTEKDNAALSDTNGVKEEINKKEAGAKKSPPIKKSVAALKSPLLKKSGTKSDAEGSTTSERTTVQNEGEVKKKRRRKRCSMSWVNKTKRKKKECETHDGVEPFSEDDDYESGQVSDTSMLSIATQDSSARVSFEPKEEKPAVDNLKLEKTLTAGVKIDAEVVKGEESKVEPAECIKEMKTAQSCDNSTGDAVADEQPVLDSPEEKKPVVECVAEGMKPLVVAEVQKLATVALPSTEMNANVVVELSSPAKESEKAMAEERDRSDEISKSEVDGDSVPAISDSPVLSAQGDNSVKDVQQLKADVSVEEDLSEGLVITKCESLANTPLEKTVLNNVIGNSQLVDVKKEIKSSDEGTTEVPAEVPLSEKDGLQENGEENDSEVKRDPDSTTCDIPRGLDDSFGDLTLYVSEEDLTHSKEHEEGLPDSTNLSQMESSTVDGEHLGAAQPVKTELLLQQFDAVGKSEPMENLTEEQKQMKESVLQALGLKSLSSAAGEVPEEKPPKRSDGYTGTLKAVIKLNRTGDKKHMVYKRSESDLASSNKLEYRICSETPADGKLVEKKLTETEDVAESDGANEEGPGKDNLVIPEKSSSFSIHPGRLCSDVCSYCFGKFGSLDTPCHVAQLKGEERQRKILENEPHLTGESCLCDACYRYVDRKANFPEKLKVGRLKPPTQASVCCVTHCSEQATRTIKRKWLVKLKKSITNKLNIDMEKLGHGVYYPFCTQHHYWVEYFTICGICRKRLNRNNLFSLGAEADRLNLMLAEDGIPARLSVNLFLCKLCRYYADLRLKYPDPTAIPNTNQNFYKSYRRKILMSLDIAVSDSDDELMQPQDESTKKSETSRDDSKADEDVMSLSNLATLLGDQPQQPARIQVKFGNVNIGTLSNLNIGQQSGNAASSSAPPTSSIPASAVHASPNVNGSSSHHKNEPTYPEVNMVANLEYQGPNTPDGSWERYQSTLQFDRKTKQLWTELQRPYGSQTSFLRHLVMLERVWRDGYLTLAPDADEAASRYITSARNRIKAFETQAPRMQTSVPATTTSAPAPVMSTPSVTTPVTRPPVPIIAKKPVPVQSFPFLTNTGEIEVTPIRTNKPSPNQPAVQRPPMVQPRAAPPTTNQRIMLGQSQPRKITPLDRAKSLVRMAPLYQQIQQHVAGERRPASGGPVRLVGAHSSIPPLVRLPQTTPNQFNQQPHQVLLQQLQQQQQHHHQQQLQLHINQQQSFFQNQPPAPQRLALPKLPRNLTVMSMPARPSLPQAITLSHSGITIEKQMAPSRAPTLPIERPSISVFREPATP